MKVDDRYELSHALLFQYIITPPGTMAHRSDTKLPSP